MTMPENDWRPINTAPKDGKIITVRYRGHAPYHVFWKDYGWTQIEYQDGGPNPTEWMPDTCAEIAEK